MEEREFERSTMQRRALAIRSKVGKSKRCS
jgi:hypothetical protein